MSFFSLYFCKLLVFCESRKCKLVISLVGTVIWALITYKYYPKNCRLYQIFNNNLIPSHPHLIKKNSENDSCIQHIFILLLIRFPKRRFIVHFVATIIFITPTIFFKTISSFLSSREIFCPLLQRYQANKKAEFSRKYKFYLMVGIFCMSQLPMGILAPFDSLVKFLLYLIFLVTSSVFYCWCYCSFHFFIL